MPDDKGNISEQEKADLAKARGEAAAQITDPKKKQEYIQKQGNTEAQKKGKLSGLDYKSLQMGAIDPNTETASYKKGTDYVPKTGPAVLHKGEAVLKKSDASKMRAAKKSMMNDLADQLGGEPEKPKKEIDHIRTRKAKSGGYIHEHHHTHPEAHPMEQHVSPDQDAMVDHMMTHMGEPNPGEAEADQGQGGIPGQ